MHAFDRTLFRRSLGMVSVLVLLGLGVMIATDEIGSTSRMRLSRLIAIAPGLIALGEGIVLAQSRARGEMRAMAALGASPFRATRGARAAGWFLGVLGIALLISPLTDPTPLFPSVVRSTPWLVLGSALGDPLTGARVTADGVVAFSNVTASAGLAQAPGRWAALASIAPLALVTPVWAAAPLGIGSRLAVAFVAIVFAIVTLHAVAAGELPTPGLVVTVLPLLAQAGWSHRKTRNA